jgi:predicted transcriptional regulator
MPKKITTMRLPADLLARLDDAAAKRGTSRTQLALQALARFLDDETTQ